jgi:pimeloyl-ACP methyl ester carboxylesterase
VVNLFLFSFSLLITLSPAVGGIQSVSASKPLTVLFPVAYKLVKNKLIFLHELMGDCTNYENCLIYFDKNLFTILMVDLRGYGLSKNILGKYNLDEAVNDVINLVTNLKLTDYVLVAHSISSILPLFFSI